MAQGSQEKETKQGTPVKAIDIDIDTQGNTGKEKLHIVSSFSIVQIWKESENEGAEMPFVIVSLPDTR